MKNTLYLLPKLSTLSEISLYASVFHLGWNVATLKHLGRNADKHSCRLFSFITAHKRSCGKVMFLHLSVNRVGGVSVRETPCTVKSGRYASYWNAFLFHGRITYGTVIYIQLSIFSDLLLKYEVNHRPYPLQPRGLINRGNWCYVNAVSFGQINTILEAGFTLLLEYLGKRISS